MKFFVVLLAFAAVANAKSICSTNWAQLTGDDRMFASAALGGPEDCSTILGQLKGLLTNPMSLNNLYGQYKIHFKKASDRAQSTIFASNLLEIAEHNAKFASGQVTWFKGVNQFTDMTPQELMAFTGDLVQDNSTSVFTLPTLTSSHSIRDAPDSLDWRTENIVAPVKNQGRCGSCWAFGTIAIVESASARKTGNLQELSEQELVDCDTSNGACNGGSFQGALKYIQNKGITTSDQYKYTGKKGRCAASGKSKAARVAQYGGVQRGDEDAMKEAVSNYGPIGTSAVVGNEWYQYKGGVYDGSCGNGGHAMATIGYGNEDGQDYWLVRNSWGDGWGEEGYMKLVRGKDKCSIASRNVVYTTVK